MTPSLPGGARALLGARGVPRQYAGGGGRARLSFERSSSYEDASTAPVVLPLPRLQRTFGVKLYGTLIFGLIIYLYKNVKDQD